jgi:hypothetical protein
MIYSTRLILLMALLLLAIGFSLSNIYKQIQPRIDNQITVEEFSFNDLKAGITDHNKNNTSSSEAEDEKSPDEPLKLPEKASSEAIEDYVNKSIMFAIQTIRPGGAGPKGLAGTQGPQGVPGGTFIAKGVLRNLKTPDLLVDRLSGKGTGALAYLAEPNYMPQQGWTLNNDKQLRNSYGQCLEADKTGTTVFMNPCMGEFSIDPSKRTISTTQQWDHDSSGRVVWSKSPAKPKCLITRSIPQLENVVKIGAKMPETMRNLTALGLEDCEATPTLDQQWAFY